MSWIELAKLFCRLMIKDKRSSVLIDNLGIAEPALKFRGLCLILRARCCDLVVDVRAAVKGPSVAYALDLLGREHQIRVAATFYAAAAVWIAAFVKEDAVIVVAVFLEKIFQVFAFGPVDALDLGIFLI